MRENNFIAFWLVFGFFIGLIIGFMSQNDPMDILSVIIFSLIFFYIMAHISVALFVRFMEFGKFHFPKETFEHKLDDFYNQLLQREAEVDSNYAYISKEDGGVDVQKGS
ncbi:MAG: hypothetical protein DSY46_06325 [Hydrogenimonas sp.]|nr:MAG: hypothetical protein DSY46_06325 [Hydrogenimonas sp.]